MLVSESALDANRQRWAIQADRGMSLFIGDHWQTLRPSGETYGEGVIEYRWENDSNDGMIRMVLNRTLNIVLSLTAIQTTDPPKIVFTPREMGEPPQYYINSQVPEAKPFIEQLVASGIDPSLPLPDDVTQYIKQAIAVSQQQYLAAIQSDMAVDKPTVPPEVLVEVSDHTKASALQTVFDAMWEECNSLTIYQENSLNKNIMGIQPLLYEFDDDEKRHILTNIHPKQFFPDPINVTSDRWKYAIFDEPIDADEAKAKWPELAKKIDQAASEGSINWQQAGQYDYGAIYDRQFRRPMVVVRNAWLRYQPYPMTPEQAIAAGKVQQVKLPTGETKQAVDDYGMPIFNELGDPVLEDVTRDALVDPATGMEITPDHPAWPKRFGIRQVRIVAGEVVDDRECEHIDIPLLVNRCIPIPFSPYALGEPSHLDGLQMAVNRVLSHLVTHQAYNAFPPEAVASSVQDRLGKTLARCKAKPGARIVVPEDLVRELGDIAKIITNLPVAAMPADAWKLLDLLLSLMDREGNHADVIRGDASSQWSGEAIANLQNAASQIIRAKASYAEHFLKQLVRLMAHSIIHRMGPEDWAKYLSKYPPVVIKTMHEGVRAMKYDVSVEIASGSGAAKQSQTNNLMAAKQAGVPIAMPTVLERLGLDPDTEAQKQAVWERKMQQMAPAQMQEPMQVQEPAQVQAPQQQIQI